MKLTSGNIIAIYFMANSQELEEGLMWYRRANQIAETIANTYKVDLKKICGVIAALSPSNKWERNCRDAENLTRIFCAGGDPYSLKVSTYGRNKQKAISILEGSDIEETLGGRKVTAFYKCMAGEDAVCIDGHAYNIWMGERLPLDKIPNIGVKLYKRIASDYIDATDKINSITSQSLKPSDVQAITWVAWRRMIKEVN